MSATVSVEPACHRRAKEMERPNSRWCWISAFEVGERSPAGFHQFVGFDAEHVVPRSCSRPHLVVLQQVGVDEHAQLSVVTEGRHAPGGFGKLRALPVSIQESPRRHPTGGARGHASGIAQSTPL